jgi:Fic family protein
VAIVVKVRKMRALSHKLLSQGDFLKLHGLTTNGEAQAGNRGKTTNGNIHRDSNNSMEPANLTVRWTEKLRA